MSGGAQAPESLTTINWAAFGRPWLARSRSPRRESRFIGLLYASYSQQSGHTLPVLTEFAGATIEEGAVLRDRPDVFRVAWRTTNH